MRKRVRLVIGEMMDGDDLAREMGEMSKPHQWEALSERSYEVVRRMEVAFNPAAAEVRT